MTPTTLQPCAVREETPCAGRQEFPRRLGPWELVRLVAEGGQAEIYQARPTQGPPNQVPAYALKLLKANWHDDARAAGLLRREAAVGRHVSHPHLVPILASVTRHSPYYLVMPWLEGATLAQRLAAGQQFDLPVVLWIARQAAEALDALWTAGWMHGDIKPGNLMLSAESHVTLIDLGFARHCDETTSVLNRYVLGTCYYMAPEMLTSALRPDIRSDIFSLGVVLYETLTGRLPYPAQTLTELVSLHHQTRPVDLRKLVPCVPADVARLIREMLAKDPFRRPQTPRDLIERVAALEIATFSERHVDLRAGQAA
jgi:serine/threonine protein kinase